MISHEMLKNGIHYYDSYRYDEAIAFFLSLKQSETDRLKMAILNLWIGKCYFQKKEDPDYSYSSNIEAYEIKFHQFHPTNSILYKPKRLFHKAKFFFDCAIFCNSNCSEAYFWKGLILQHKGKITKAYTCFAKATLLAPQNKFAKYRRTCSKLFATYKDLPFLETRPLGSISLKEAIELCASKDAYTRFEACQRIFQEKKHPHQLSSIKNAITPLAGKRTLFFYLPFQGDADHRIREISRNILESLKEKNENSFFSLLTT
ncbi:hypothetical protein [Parachlamydia acanthamoebae]|uniref:hypothetical protein n=1 Tax=Parachlamydia acanthamoebae TaxID=83552 RepID=UPI000751550A|nr:hypothetical protein [Parachlamydia acanthamoebae]